MFKKMAKKIIGFIIGIALLCSNIFSINVQAADTFYTEQGENLLEYLQTEYPSMLQLNSNYEYVRFVNDFNSSWLSLYLLHITDFFANTGVEPDEKKYMEVLLNIIETHDLSESATIANQKKMDNLKTFEDYGKDMAKAGAKAVSVMSGLSDSTDALSQKISKAVDGLAVLTDTTENWIEALSELETSVQNYSYYSEFLQIIEENSEGDLKKAAVSLRKNLESGMKIRLEAYADITNENIGKWSEEYFSDVFFETCKLTEEYEADDTLKWFVDSGQNVMGKFKTIKDSWELGKAVGLLLGDITVGGENLINRLREVMAVNEISKLLSENLQSMAAEEFNDVIGTKKELDFVQKYVMQSKFLVNCRVRGEYCWYSIIANDAGLLSYFNKETGKNIEKMYNGMVAAMEEIDAELDKIMECKIADNNDISNQFYGSWLQLDSDDPVVLTLKEDMTLQYYNSISYENVYNSTFEWNNGLYLNLLNITDMNVTSVPYQVEVNETKNPLQMILTVDNTEDFPDTTQLYGMEKILEGTYERISFSNEQLEAIKTKLGVPADMEVHIIQNPPYFWDAGQCWLVQVDIYDKNNQYLAGAAFDSKTMEMCKDIYMYAGF